MDPRKVKGFNYILESHYSETNGNQVLLVLLFFKITIVSRTL